MRRAWSRLSFRLSWLVAAPFVAAACAAPRPEETAPAGDGETGEIAQATTCGAKLDFYPVQGKHNNGYDKTAGDKSQWTCDDAHSNTDFNKSHIGNDIWASEGTPVLATVSGTLRYVGNSAYSGNKVTIVDKCGWYHFFCHLQKLGPGLSASSNGKHVDAGQIIGYVGKTGTASNGVVHLHYSLYPDDNYDAGIDPWPYLHAVEKNTCGCQPTAEVCNGKDDDCDGKVDEDGVCNKAPKGNVDAVDCAKGVVGWAQDEDAPDKAIAAHVYFDGPAGKGKAVSIAADDPRDDLCKPLGSCNHAFALPVPLSLLDGKPHEVYAYAIDSAGGPNTQLTGSPQKLQCPATMPTGVTRWIVDPAAYTAWAFDAFTSQLPLPAAEVDAYPTGTDLPKVPSLVRADGQPAVYLVDTGCKRHVPSPAILKAWKLDTVEVKVKTLAEIDALPTGPVLRPVPVTAVGAKGRIVLFDDPLPTTNEAGTAGAGGTGGAKAGGAGGTTSPGGGNSGSGGESNGAAGKSGSVDAQAGHAGAGAGPTGGAGGKAGGTGGTAGQKTGPDADGGPTVVPGSAESGDCCLSPPRLGERDLPAAPLASLASLGLVLAQRRRVSSRKVS